MSVCRTEDSRVCSPQKPSEKLQTGQETTYQANRIKTQLYKNTHVHGLLHPKSWLTTWPKKTHYVCVYIACVILLRIGGNWKASLLNPLTGQYRNDVSVQQKNKKNHWHQLQSFWFWMCWLDPTDNCSQFSFLHDLTIYFNYLEWSFLPHHWQHYSLICQLVKMFCQRETGEYNTYERILKVVVYCVVELLLTQDKTIENMIHLSTLSCWRSTETHQNTKPCQHLCADKKMGRHRFRAFKYLFACSLD